MFLTLELLFRYRIPLNVLESMEVFLNLSIIFKYVLWNVLETMRVCLNVLDFVIYF